MKVLTAIALYLFAAFLLVALSLTSILPTDYLGGMVIGLYLIALFYAFANAIRSGEKLDRAEKSKMRETVEVITDQDRLMPPSEEEKKPKEVVVSA